MVIALKPPSTRTMAPGDEARGTPGRQPDRGAHELVRLTEPPGRGVAEDGPDPVLGQQLSVLLGREEAGRDGVDADLVRCQLAGKELGQVVQAGLRHGVGQDA